MYNSESFTDSEIAVTNAISTLRRHGFDLRVPESLKNRWDIFHLFDGDDGLFKELIKVSRVYFEYGCGKSTEYVFKFTGASIASVDTSKVWVEKIRRLDGNSLSGRLSINWVDVGEVGDWGTPTSFRLRKNFRNYAEILWSSSNIPDLVLIDGRFRLLCFLTTIKLGPVGTKILFDDYLNRPFYHVAEEVCDRLETCGRQALFEITSISKDRVDENMLLEFQNIID